MALFQRSTKTRIWGTTGLVTFKKFLNSQKQKSISISLLDPQGKRHCITLYADEVETLQYVLSKGTYEDIG